MWKNEGSPRSEQIFESVPIVRCVLSVAQPKAGLSKNRFTYVTVTIKKKNPA
jgi:hypothetical protein